MWSLLEFFSKVHSRKLIKALHKVFFFRETRHNVPSYFNHSADTIVYFSEKAYVFDPNTSCANCDPMVDKIRTINIPLLVSTLSLL